MEDGKPFVLDVLGKIPPVCCSMLWGKFFLWHTALYGSAKIGSILSFITFLIVYMLIHIVLYRNEILNHIIYRSGMRYDVKYKKVHMLAGLRILQ